MEKADKIAWAQADDFLRTTFIKETSHLSTAAPPRQQAGFSAESAETNDRKYSSSPERLKAVKEYTDAFGGSMEENMAALRGLSIEEIRDAIDKGLSH